MIDAGATSPTMSNNLQSGCLPERSTMALDEYNKENSFCYEDSARFPNDYTYDTTASNLDSFENRFFNDKEIVEEKPWAYFVSLTICLGG